MYIDILNTNRIYHWFTIKINDDMREVLRLEPYVRQKEIRGKHIKVYVTDLVALTLFDVTKIMNAFRVLEPRIIILTDNVLDRAMNKALNNIKNKDIIQYLKFELVE